MKLSTNWVSFENYIKLLESDLFEDKTLYHSKSWLMAVSKGFNVDIKPIKTCDAKGNVIATIPYAFKKKGPFKLFGSPLRGLYTEFTGALFAKNINKDEKLLILKSQNEFIKKLADYIEFGFQDGKDNMVEETFKNMGYEPSTRSSTIIDLNVSEGELLKGYTGRARNMIRKSEKMDVSVSKIVPNKKWIEEYYNLLNDAFIRQGSSCPHPLSFFHELIDFNVSQNVLFLEALKDGKFVAGSIFLLDRCFEITTPSNA